MADDEAPAPAVPGSGREDEQRELGYQCSAGAPPTQLIERVAEAALQALPRLVEQWFPAGKWRGTEYVVGDLQGNQGESLSINTNTGAWCDFAAPDQRGGDPVSLLAALRGYGGEHPQLDAARELAAELGIDLGERPAPPSKGGGKGTPIVPVPADAPAPPDVFNRKEKDGSWTRLEVSQRWEYRDAEGRLLGAVCRFDLPNGDKEVIPQTYCEHEDGTRRWRWLSFAKPRPLYGLDRLAAHPSANVVIAEGEKAADAGHRTLSGKGVVVISWPGGGKAVHHADWSALAGRKVVLWPDADEAGRDTAEGYRDAGGRMRKGIAQLVEPHADGVRVVDPPDDVAEGWDLADAERDGWTADDVLGWIRRHVRHATPREPNAGDGGVPMHPESLPSSGTPTSPADERPRVVVEGGQLPHVVDGAEAALLRSGAPVYERAGRLVRVARASSDGYVARDAAALVLVPVEADWLADTLTRVARFEKFDGRTRAYREIDCPRRVALTYLARAGQWQVPRLHGTIFAPTVRVDGSVIELPGYDDPSALLAHFDATAFGTPPVPRSPTADDARAALEVLREALGGFPWISAADEAVAIAGMVTALVRRSLPTAPAFAFSAPVRGAGKSLAVDVCAIPATGARAAVLSAGWTDEELEKRLASALLAGDLVLSIDNIERPLSGELLCQVLTQPAVRLRPLGASQLQTVPTDATVFATGNNLVVAGDAARRILVAEMDPQSERPELRRFETDLLVEVARARSALVSAALTIVRAYLVAGSPNLRLPPFGSFETWSAVVRSALVYAGASDPCDVLERAQREDPEREALLALVDAWRGAFGPEARSVRDAIERSERDASLADAIDAVAGERGSVNARRLGKYIKRKAHRIVGGLAFEQASEPGERVARWQVVRK